MKNFIKKYFPIILSVIIFINFGLYHISKFETIDEHFWKYDRIEKYFNGIKQHNLKKTRINDKPGVTVALISGIGLPFSPSLSNHEDINRENKYLMPKDNGKMRKLYTLYKTDETQKLNYALRLPILLFNGLVMLPIIFWLLTRAFDRRVASIGIILIGLNPILIGISQIINPDALLWSFSTAAILSFFALLRRDALQCVSTKNTRRCVSINKNHLPFEGEGWGGVRKTLKNNPAFIFTLLTGIFTGFALLSKYSANLLFVFYSIVFVYHFIEKSTKYNSFTELLLFYTKKLLTISLLSWSVVAIFMPAVIITPKHFLYATIYSPPFEPIISTVASLLTINNYLFTSQGDYKLLPLTVFSLLTLYIIFAIIPSLLIVFFRKYRNLFTLINKFIIIALLTIFVLSFVNAWFDTPLFDLDNLKEVSRSGGKVSFPQFDGDNTIVFWTKAILVEAQNFVFSLHPITILFLFIINLHTLLHRKNQYTTFIYFTNAVPFVFFVGGLLSNVFVNVRYSLMLYPLFAIITAIGLITVCDKIKFKFKKPLFLALVLITGITSLWNIKPFYFNYTNSLLPHKYVVTDSWGYGFWEAAQYLNNLPNAKNLVIWSDRAGLCQFFVGKCINSREVYLDYTNVDYLLLTRRGSLIRKPVPISKDAPTVDFDRYYEPKYFNNPVWELDIDSRPKNFIKLIKIETKNP